MPHTITQALKALSQKHISSAELTTSFLDKIKANTHNAFILTTADIALAQAKASDTRRANGQKTGLLDGIPLGIKDLFCTANVRTTACSRMLADFVPPYESTVSQNLWNHGAVMLGKLNMDEFAMGSGNLNSFFGPVKNPWSPDDTFLVPGGSSGGSAAAIAAGLCLGATGSDTGGSIRQPAAFCGLTGLKPTYGRCSRYGMIAFASSLDQAGPMALTVADTALMFQAMAGWDAKDSTSSQQDIQPFDGSSNIKGLRVGIPKEYKVDGLSAPIQKAWEDTAALLQSLGAELIDVSLPHTDKALPTYYVLAPAEASSNLSRYDGVRYGYRTPNDVSDLDDLYRQSRSEGFGAEVKRRIMMGTHVLSAGCYESYYLQAQKVRRLVKQDFNNVFESVDVLLTPTTPTTAFGKDQKMSQLEVYANDVLTVPASLAGQPALSLPVGLDDKGLPIGMQLIGPMFQENRLFTAGQAIEDAVDFKHKI
jgi:aspartyl-tRNA(Asn)/glutamyl-tRNA(Gln) amidotransferase subunit A